MYDISQNSFYLYSVHRTLVSGEHSRANGLLVFLCNFMQSKECKRIRGLVRTVGFQFCMLLERKLFIFPSLSKHGKLIDNCFFYHREMTILYWTCICQPF